jgi:hypothetical protein
MDPAEITYEMVNRKMREIVMSRGRRGTDKMEQASQRVSERRLHVAFGPGIRSAQQGTACAHSAAVVGICRRTTGTAADGLPGWLLAPLRRLRCWRSWSRWPRALRSAWRC